MPSTALSLSVPAVRCTVHRPSPCAAPRPLSTVPAAHYTAAIIHRTVEPWGIIDQRPYTLVYMYTEACAQARVWRDLGIQQIPYIESLPARTAQLSKYSINLLYMVISSLSLAPFDLSSIALVKIQAIGVHCGSDVAATSERPMNYGPTSYTHTHLIWRSTVTDILVRDRIRIFCKSNTGAAMALGATCSRINKTDNTNAYLKEKGFKDWFQDRKSVV